MGPDTKESTFSYHLLYIVFGMHIATYISILLGSVVRYLLLYSGFIREFMVVTKEIIVILVKGNSVSPVVVFLHPVSGLDSRLFTACKLYVEGYCPINFRGPYDLYGLAQ